jgi:hypothetical protein
LRVAELGYGESSVRAFSRMRVRAVKVRPTCHTATQPASDIADMTYMILDKTTWYIIAVFDIMIS